MENTVNTPETTPTSVFISRKAYVATLVSEYCDFLMLGYSYENWTGATRKLRELSRFVDIETYTKLGTLMSETYADHGSMDEITRTRKSVLKNLNNSKNK